MRGRTDPGFHGTERFEVERQLGAGGMGVVYRAFDHEQQAHVALKTLRRIDAQNVYRFKNEFRTLQDLRHPNLVGLGELFESDGQWFFTMELVEGVDFLRYVRRPTGELDVPRLRAAMGQLARALAALHAAGKLHRDVKPNNVLVTAEGRAVLLDFGLVTDVDPGDASTERNAVGTAAYMAPEQADARLTGPPADCYAAGVMLYEALTGRPPFTGPPMRVLMDKQVRAPEPPAQVAPGVPPDLAELAMALLQFDPSARPTAEQLLRRLGDAEPDDGASRSTDFTQTPSFQGRAEELAVLQRAIEESRDGARTIVVRGEAGIGKSALARQLTEVVAASQPDAVVLSGRCYEREDVPYKAFDGVVDSLSGYLRRLPAVEAAGYLPRHAALLRRLFPVLGRVEVIAEAPAPRGGASDVQSLQDRAFDALRELVTRIAEVRPLVIVIDDFQWADADSEALLGELMRPPDAPPVLVVLLVRDAPDAPARTPEKLSGEVRVMELDALPPVDARRLAKRLLARSGAAGQVSPAVVASEARGHPLYIVEIIGHLALAGERVRGRLQLEDAIRSRVGRLAPLARRLMEIVCLAEAPLEESIVRAATGLDPVTYDRHAGVLRVSHLMRRTAGGDARVEPYHDWVRDAVLNRMDAELRGYCHGRIATTLETSEIGARRPELLLKHLIAAGRMARAAEVAQQAARAASDALAFDRAAELYALALRLGEADEGRADALQRALGEALYRAGRGPEAAHAFLEAAERADSAEGLELRSRAAEALLRAGHMAEGVEVLRAALDEVGMRYPKGRRRAMVLFAWRRLGLSLSGIPSIRSLRGAEEVPPQTLRRIDVCWSAATGMSLADPVLGAELQARHLKLALRAKERFRVARALCLEVGYRAALAPGSRRADRLARRAREIADVQGDPYLRGWAAAARALLEYQRGRFRASLAETSAALEVMASRFGSDEWEIAQVRMIRTWSLYYLGRIGELARDVPKLLLRAERRGDRHGATNVATGLPNAAWLAADDPVRAARIADEAIGRWDPDGQYLQQIWWFVARLNGDLYTGDAESAWRRSAEIERRLASSLFLRVPMLRVETMHARGRGALAYARTHPGDADVLRVVRRIGDGLARSKHSLAPAFAALLRAGVAAATGDEDAAVLGFRDAARRCDEGEMALYAAAARHRVGELIGGDEGEELRAGAIAELRAQRVRDPARMMAVFAAQVR